MINFSQVIEKMDRAELIKYLMENTNWTLAEMAIVETEPLRNEARIKHAILLEQAVKISLKFLYDILKI